MEEKMRSAAENDAQQQSAGSGSSGEQSPARRSPTLGPGLPDMRSLRSTWSSEGSNSPFFAADFATPVPVIRYFNKVPRPETRVSAGSGAVGGSPAPAGSPEAPSNPRLAKFSSSFKDFIQAGYAEKVLM